MKLKDYNLLLLLMLSAFSMLAQQQISGTITNLQGSALEDVGVYDKTSGLLTKSDANGFFTFETEKETLELTFFDYEYQVFEQTVLSTNAKSLKIKLAPLAETTLSEVEITLRKAKLFSLKQLNDVEETAIYAGKKTEVVLIDQSMANLGANNARQLYSQVAGLNIYQNDDAGLQLNIGGRGLDPNRTANFNTRQNGYDISADVLGYPESYYTPTAEALQEIQIVRGAASLQYGTQFGGLVNFKMKTPNKEKPLELITRNTIGSNGLYTNFTSANGTKGKFSYYTFFNYKKGDGFRDNSNFESKNFYAHLGYQFNDKTKLEGEVTYLRYLAKQGGGLSDAAFKEDPYQSNRARNWFQVDWLLYNLKLSHKFSENTNFTFNAFGLNASRDALGFRTNRVDQADDNGVRDLIKGQFDNFGFETRVLTNYNLFNKKAIGLLGAKFYKSENTAEQGPGSDGIDPNFDFQYDTFPNYSNQSDFTYPNLNVAIFGENIVYLNDEVSITPGFRFEYINTQSDGYFRRINTDAAGNVILNEKIEDDLTRERSFVLLGLGASYKPSTSFELYGNVSQNYRSVTFTDISITNPAFVISPDIDDESGFTVDAGVRGRVSNKISYDVSAFSLFYNDRIGFIQRGFADGSVKSERGNVGDAMMYGVESLVEFNLENLLLNNEDYIFNYYVNMSFVDSEYTKSDENGVEGNKVEFIPNYNFKTGIRLGYKDFLSNIQYTYLSSQFTDATNSTEGNLSGVTGEIPAYDVLDVSFSYKYKQFKLEAGVNNLLDNAYFTRRATGYPGPGIIPSANRNFYTTLEIKF
ncbi:TonB-dependent receptor domain-containing protein [Olleya sp. 1-3]|uniref:TonB-dependent receptor domain-containing protein n=1 Tax=Olleya sp. 1-3 TaxID=2058323 RepID=UPI000C31ECEA|nr:TonB-dependent receptor [Olleya sp. 1-3]PKG51666.1 TonB-dependent receptor [Olleya sp. 1-3]